jgi:hypothetical protein
MFDVMVSYKITALNKKNKSCGDRFFGTFDLFRQLAVCQSVTTFFRSAFYSK